MPDESDDVDMSGEEVSIASKVPAEDKAEIRMLASVNGTTMSRWVAEAIQEKLARTPDRTRELARELARESNRGNEENKNGQLVSAG